MGQTKIPSHVFAHLCVYRASIDNAHGRTTDPGRMEVPRGALVNSGWISSIYERTQQCQKRTRRLSDVGLPNSGGTPGTLPSSTNLQPQTSASNTRCMRPAAAVRT